MNVLNSEKDKKVKRILVYGMTSNRGGIESYLMNYFRRLVLKGIVFDFVTDYQEIAYKEEIEELGGKVYFIPNRRDGLLKHMKSLRNILLEHEEYKSVYFNILSASEVFTVLSAAGIKGVKKIVHSHNNDVKTIGRHRVLRPLLTKISDVKLACSDEAAEFMFGKRQTSDQCIQIINNAIDIEKYAYSPEKRDNTREKFGISEEMFVVGHVGRMCYQKNTLFLLDIFNEIYKRDNNAILMLVGNGEDRELVEDKINQYDMRDNVLMLGMRDDVELLMQAMDVFLFPSRFEGFGMVLIEAQAAGLNCVASKDVVPETTNITNRVQFVSLDNNADYWAMEVLKYRKSEREDTLEAITKAGFNIDYESEKLAKLLRD